jgi:hypothetical protein
MDGAVPASPASIEWRELHPGVLTSVLAGRPETEGAPFVLLYRTAVPLTMRSPSHPDERHVTVLGGSLELGIGETFDETEIEMLGPGSYAVIPGGVPHVLRCSSGSIVQIHGVGPFLATYP